MRFLYVATGIFTLFFLFTSIGYANLTDGLIAYWSFNNPSDPYNDDSGNGNNGTGLGSPTWVEGIRGGAIEFDNADDLIRVPYDESMNTSAGVTYASWFSPDQVIINANIIGRWDLSNQELVQIDVGHGGTLNYWDWYFNLTCTAPQVGRWTHVAVIIEPGAFANLYVDGELVDSKVYPNATVTNPVGPLEIGGSDPFYGIIDDVRIYNRALSKDEVAELSTIPAPGAIILGSIGAGFVGWMRRKRAI